MFSLIFAQKESSPPNWIIPWLGATIYPGFLIAFSRTLEAAQNSGSILNYLLATGFMVIAFLTPLYSLGFLYFLKSPANKILSVRKIRLLHLIAAVPPLYVFSFVVLNSLGILRWLTPMWVIVWTIGGISVLLQAEKIEQQRRRQNPVNFKRLHGLTAIIVVIIFLTLHLINQAVAFWSVELHEQLIQLFRIWYRVLAIEILILLSLVLLALSGLFMILHNTRIMINKFKILQTVSGTYLAAFLCAHVYAVMNARLNDVDTNWYFATGPAGLLYTNSMLIPYYSLAVFLLFSHLALGLRSYLLSHKYSEATATRALHIITAFGFLFTLIIMIAALGFGLFNK